MSEQIVVVGGGPGGMMAAYAAAKEGAKVTLLEKNEKLGKKLFLTGKGRCNITNARQIEDFFAQVPRNPKFLYSAFYTLTNDDLVSLLNKAGLKTKVERGGRIFPASDKSSDVIRALLRLLQEAKVNIDLHQEVCGLEIENGRIAGVKTRERVYPCAGVVLATGGFSYRSTGSDGAGHKIAEALGHTITPIHPSLIPMVCKGGECKAMQGLALKNVEFRLKDGKKELFSEQGEMLFTHFGISGPIVLSASAHLKKYDFSRVIGEIDCKPALSEEKLEQRLLRDFRENPNRQFGNALAGLLPKKMVPVVLKRTGISPEKQVNGVTRAEREALVHLLKHFELEISGLRSMNEAIITRGGISVKEIDPSTMRSKKIDGLYFAGEMMDVDAYTGGFNLQIAFSTGYLAGMSAALSQH